jgi:hypothetical protein
MAASFSKESGHKASYVTAMTTVRRLQWPSMLHVKIRDNWFTDLFASSRKLS